MEPMTRERLVELRRSFHRYPEPAWCEFATTARLVDALTEIGVDDLAIGTQAYDSSDRMAVPDPETITKWRDRAETRGVDSALLDEMAGGHTGVVAALEQGDGPTVGLRVDIDGLCVEEATGDEHLPTREGFRSETGETMHACGHDIHMTWGLATIAAIKQSTFDGRLVVFFQPAEEVSGGGAPMAKSPYADDLDYFFGAHVGLGHPSGEIVAGIERPLAEARLEATIHGTAAHAGTEPEAGDNAMQALGAVIQNTYAIPRHSDGATRVNVGTVEAGTAANIIPDRAVIEADVRGETTTLMEHMRTRLHRILETASKMHGCSVDITPISEAPRADSDPELVDVIATVAQDSKGVDSVLPSADFGAGEDATFLMKRVQETGGLASYLIIGANHPTGHHTPTFDVDEDSLEIGVDVLTNSILAVATVA